MGRQAEGGHVASLASAFPGFAASSLAWGGCVFGAGVGCSGTVFTVIHFYQSVRKGASVQSEETVQMYQVVAAVLHGVAEGAAEGPASVLSVKKR